MKPPSHFLLFTAALVSTLSASAAEKLVIKGSDTLGAKFVPQLAEAFKAGNPDVGFEIAAEGSATGISAIVDGTANIGMSSRPVKATEDAGAKAKGVKFVATEVAMDGIAVILNEANGLKNLTRKQVEQIFSGDVTDWSAVGGKPGKISIYTRNTSSGTYADFKELAMKKRDYAATAQKMAGNEQIAQEVSKNPSGIGYVGLAYLKNPGIRAVSIDGIALSDATVLDKTYAYSRPTFFYTNGEPAGLTRKFIDFTLGAEGSRIARQVGFVPVK